MKILFRWVPRLILIAIILFLFVGVIAYLVKSDEPPSVKDAPWAIQTYSNDEFRIPSRIFYAKEVEIIDSTPIIKEYWSYDGAKYKHHKKDKAFPVDVYGNIGITRRVQ